MNDYDFQVLQLGDPNLRIISLPVTDISSERTHSFITALFRFVTDVHGMGIAAPQVGTAERLFIMSSKPNARYPYAPEMEPTVVINPEILWQSSDIEKDWEGCLSIPGIRALVPRHNIIKVAYTSLSGHQITTEYSGFISRLFQHEFDHLDGVVFLDRVESADDIMMENQWVKMISQL
ncbi:MAG: peptide deformylase [Gammaproteobacteria bacterium]|nr:peptide deformylase [Gammaproteobacteria bacterium]